MYFYYSFRDDSCTSARSCTERTTYWTTNDISVHKDWHRKKATV